MKVIYKKIGSPQLYEIEVDQKPGIEPEDVKLALESQGYLVEEIRDIQKKTINDFCGINDNLTETLLDSFQMTEWDMTWVKFIEQAQKEINTHLEKLKLEQIEEEELL